MKAIGFVVTFLKKRWKWIVLVLLILASIAWWQYGKYQAARPELTFKKPSIENLTKTLEVSGIVDAKQRATMRFAAGGKVTYLGAQEGEAVKKGQTLAVIDRRELEKRLQMDLNSYMRERWDWDQLQDDSADRTLPKNELREVDKAQLNLDDTVLAVEIRDIAIRNTVLSAPFAGLLVKAPTSVVGLQVTPTEAWELVDPATLIFEAAVDEADIGLVKVGQKATISLDSYPDEDITTYVQNIAITSSQTSTGTVFVVEFAIPNATDLSKYKLGMNGDVTIELETRENVMSVPLDAIRERDDKTYVNVRTGEFTYTEREISTDLETDTSVEVTKGLSKDDEVLIPE
jgi:RND family efflux transporter MFP subunit